MRRYWLGVMLAAAVLTSGCGKEAEPVETAAVSEAAAEVSIQDTEAEEEQAEDESLKEAWESLEAAEESLKAREESLEAAEETRPSEEESTPLRLYRKLLEDPENHKGKAVFFSGNVVRAASDGAGNGQVVLAVEGQETARLVCDYRESLIDEKLMAGDQVTVSGIFQTTNRYRMDSGNIETLPAIRVSSFDTVTLAVRETAPAQTGESREADTGAASVQGADTGAASAQTANTGAASAQGADTGAASAQGADTGAASARTADTGAAPARTADTESEAAAESGQVGKSASQPASGNAETAASGAQAEASGQEADYVTLEDDEQVPAAAFPETEDPEIPEDDQDSRASRVVGPAVSPDMSGPGVERP